MFYVYQLPVPRLQTSDPQFTPIIERAGKLICTTPEFDELAHEIGLGDHHNGVTDPAGRACLRAELDGLVAHLYGLTEEEFSHVLGTFPLVAEPVKQAALEAFRRMTPEGELAALIASGEDDHVEFKQGAFMGLFTHRADDSMRKNVAEAVCAFMNSHGGTILIGLTDEGEVLGIDEEFGFANPSKANWDGYQLALTDVLQSRLGIVNPFRFYTITNCLYYGKTLCRIDVRPADEPVYIDKKLHVREGNRTRELQGPDLIHYVQSHWNRSK